MPSILYLQSGGPTSVINTSLYGVIKEAKKHPEITGIYGSLFGIYGILNDEIIDLRQEDDETIELLLQTSGAALGTARHKLNDDMTSDEYIKIVATLMKYDIRYLFINGGNDSMDTCNKLDYYLKSQRYDCCVIGIPKTIDNDLALLDHSLGFPSAAKYVIQTIQNIRLDCVSYSRGKIILVEVMGRNAGWLTASCVVNPLSKPDLLYLPENPFDMEAFLSDVQEIYLKNKSCLVVLSEGVPVPDKFVKSETDAFGHFQFGGVANLLASIIGDRFGFQTRSIELNTPQRSAPFLISKVDQKEAIKVSEFAVQNALEGKSGKMVCIKRISNKPYRIKLELGNVSNIANFERKIPESMFIDSKNDLDHSFYEYLLPLIKGEIDLKYQDGILKSAVLKKIKPNI